jgi:hypothetical protein
VTSCFRGETLGPLQLNYAFLILMFGVVLATRIQNILYSKNLIKINKIYFIFAFTPLFLSKKINQKGTKVSSLCSSFIDGHYPTGWKAWTTLSTVHHTRSHSLMCTSLREAFFATKQSPSSQAV